MSTFSPSEYHLPDDDASENPAAICPSCGQALCEEVGGLCPSCVSAVLLGILDEPDDDAFAPVAGETGVIEIEGYRLHAVVGSGGMGRVYRATRESDGREVAVKFLHAPWLHSPEVRDRFRMEVETAAAVDDPRLVNILDSGLGRAEEVFYYVMEFVDGKSINRHVKEAGLDTAGIVRLFLELCEAVSSAHRNGVLHRDLKPHNILINERGEVRVLDFGLARFLDAESAENSLTRQVPMGTEGYTAPERMTGGRGSTHVRIDVFALGVIFYQLLSGGPGPYSREQDRRDVPLRSVAAGRPADLEALCGKAVAYDPAERYQSVDLLAGDLRRYLRGEAVTARPLGAWRRFRRLMRRHPKTSWFAGLAGMLVFALAVGMVAFGLSEARARRDLEAAAQARDRNLAELYVSCDSANVAAVYESLGPEAHRYLRFVRESAPTASMIGRRARIEVLRLGGDGSNADFGTITAAIERASDLREAEFLARRMELWSAGHREEFWNQVAVGEPKDSRMLRMAVALAIWDPGATELWREAAPHIAERVALYCQAGNCPDQVSAMLSSAMPALRPAFRRLADALGEGNRTANGLLAILIEPEFRERLERMISSDEQFIAEIEAVRYRTYEAAAWLASAHRGGRFHHSAPDIDARVRAIAGVVMLLGPDCQEWRHFRASSRLRLLMIERFPKLRVPASLVAERFLKNPKDGVAGMATAAGILLCLSGYPADELDDGQKRLINQEVERMLTVVEADDPRSAEIVRDACEAWLLGNGG